MPQPTGKLLIAAGVLLVLFGLFVTIGHKYIPLGKLPGDIIIRKQNFTFYFPIATCILLSILAMLAFNLFRK